jgi:hypothetical protein
MGSVYKGPERRSVQRAKMVTFCPSHFDYGGRQYEALMVDLSEKGAGFRMEHEEESLHMVPGEELSFTIRTPYGPSECAGRLVWMERREQHTTWGVSFTRLPEDSNDPLRALMDSPF